MADEKALEELQMLALQLQQILLQKQELQYQLTEVENALEQIKKAQGKIYKMIGNFLVEISKDDAIKELEEKKELLDLRIKALTRQEEKIRSRLNELKDKAKEISG